MAQSLLNQELAALIPGFIKRREQDVDAMKNLLAEKDFDGVAALAHKVKGNGAAFGFPYLSDIGARLETSAKSKDAFGSKEIVKELQEALFEIRRDNPLA